MMVLQTNNPTLYRPGVATSTSIRYAGNYTTEPMILQVKYDVRVATPSRFTGGRLWFTTHI